MSPRPTIAQVFFPFDGASSVFAYEPALLGEGRAFVEDAKRGVSERVDVRLLARFDEVGSIDWLAAERLAPGSTDPAERPARLTGFGATAGVVLAVQLTLGAWVAGLNAGHASDTWPLMQGGLFPTVDWSKGAGWALTHDPFLLHFMHRWWAWVVVAELVILGRAARRAGNRTASVAVHSAFGTQILLGIATVLTGVALWLAVLHQLVGALLVAATAWAAHATGKRS